MHTYTTRTSEAPMAAHPRINLLDSVAVSAKRCHKTSARALLTTAVDPRQIISASNWQSRQRLVAERVRSRGDQPDAPRTCTLNLRHGFARLDKPASTNEASTQRMHSPSRPERQWYLIYDETCSQPLYPQSIQPIHNLTPPPGRHPTC